MSQRAPHPPRVLVVDDDRAVRESLRRSLEFNGYDVHLAGDGAEALAGIGAVAPDVVVMDVMMPRLDGLDATRALRAAGNDVPILVLTARDAVGDRVEGLDAGADDYLTKPFAPKELSARIRALLRRARTSDHRVDHLKFGDLEIAPDEGEVTLAGETVHLTKTEFRLLIELASNPGKVFSREVLLDRIWGYGYFGDGRLVDVHVRRLRMKVEPDPANPRHVVTVRGLGYKLAP